jgi:hypothetical protein
MTVVETLASPYDPSMSMLVATQVTAIATAALAALAIAAGITAGRALWLQAQEVRILKQDHDREVNDRRGAQASAVFMWENRPIMPSSSGGGTYPVNAAVKNASDKPIYDLYFIWNWNGVIHQRYQRSAEGLLMPGEEAKASYNAPNLKMRDSYGAYVIFRDTAGVIWLRKPDGYLIELTPNEAEKLQPGKELPVRVRKIPSRSSATSPSWYGVMGGSDPF